MNQYPDQQGMGQPGGYPGAAPGQPAQPGVPQQGSWPQQPAQPAQWPQADPSQQAAPPQSGQQPAWPGQAPAQGGFGQQAPGGFGQQAPGGFGQQAPGGFGQQAPGGFGQQAPGGFGQQAPGGFGQQPSAAGGPKKTNVILLVAVALVVVIVAGVVIHALVGKKEDPPPVNVPSPTSTATPQPTTQPPTPQPTPSPSETTAPPSSGDVSVGNGMSVTMPSGWKNERIDTNSVAFANADESVVMLITTAPSPTGDGSTDAHALMETMVKGLTGTKRQPATKVNVDPALSVGEEVASGTSSTANGSQAVVIDAIASVRLKDKAALNFIIVGKSSADIQGSTDDIGILLKSGIASQLAG